MLSVAKTPVRLEQECRATNLRVPIMTQLLEQALSAIQSLPESEQDAIAERILAEIAEDQRWDAAFAKSPEKLARMAAKAREDIQAGRVRSGGFDGL